MSHLRTMLLRSAATSTAPMSRLILQGRVKVLVLTRKCNQSIMIGDDIEVTVLSVVGEKVRLGIQAPSQVHVYRSEIYAEITGSKGSPDLGQSPEALHSQVDEALRRLGGEEDAPGARSTS